MKKLGYVLVLGYAIVSQSCINASSKNVTIEASLENSSAHDVDWVRMEWEGPQFSAGILRIGIFKTDVSLRWPFVQTGRLTFVDYTTRRRYNVDISFTAINEKVRSGDCRAITIRILDYDKVEIVCGHPRDSGR
jgi:hypothetical protein